MAFSRKARFLVVEELEFPPPVSDFVLVCSKAASTGEEWKASQVGCPGRMQDFISSGDLRVDHCYYVVSEAALLEKQLLGCKEAV